MASLQQRRSHTLQYFDQFDYPLTESELHHWLHGKTFFSNKEVAQTQKYWHLKDRKSIIQLRKQRYKISQKKWAIAKQISSELKAIKTIQAIFVTGALAMNNCPEKDDIDIMIVCSPFSLWFTRWQVFNLLQNRRRPSSVPEHASDRVSDKICDNLYLETSHLQISNQSLYTAHEIMQAKCIYDRAEYGTKFVQTNSWIKNYLPHAASIQKPSQGYKHQASITSVVTKTVNAIYFCAQYIYMYGKITHETISLHQAFFHPRQQNYAKN